MTPTTALVTGASRGLGEAIAAALREDGHTVLTPAREELDLEDRASIHSYLESIAALPVGILVNNAASNRPNLLGDLPLEDWDSALATNLTAPFLLTREVGRSMVERGWGRIVNVSSCYSFLSRPGRSAYAASKAGLNALTRTAALEYATSGVLVNAVCPGFVATDMTRQNNSPEQIAALCGKVPMARLAEAEEVARLVRFLASEENTYITGQTIVIDGGFSIQ